MKSRSTLNLVLVLAVFFAASCKNKCKDPSGKVITQNRSVPRFSKLAIKGGFDVTLVQDTGSRVEINADENFMEAIQTSGDGGELLIKEDGDCNGGQIKLVVHSANYEEISLAGSIDFHTQGNLRLRDVAFSYAGRVDADLNLNAAKVETNAAGKVDVKMKGQASEHKVDIAGSGTLDALDFVVAKYSVETAGATDCKINVLNELNVKAMGSGDVTYKGNPAKINQDIKGSGAVKKAQ